MGGAYWLSRRHVKNEANDYGARPATPVRRGHSASARDSRWSLTRAAADAALRRQAAGSRLLGAELAGRRDRRSATSTPRMLLALRQSHAPMLAGPSLRGRLPPLRSTFEPAARRAEPARTSVISVNWPVTVQSISAVIGRGQARPALAISPTSVVGVHRRMSVACAQATP